jgi:hypothetical protein
MLRWALLAAVGMLGGCNESPAPPPPENQKAASPLPPEVEFDPATAAAKYKQSGPQRR